MFKVNDIVIVTIRGRRAVGRVDEVRKTTVSVGGYTYVRHTGDLYWGLDEAVAARVLDVVEDALRFDTQITGDVP